MAKKKRELDQRVNSQVQNGDRIPFKVISCTKPIITQGNPIVYSIQLESQGGLDKLIYGAQVRDHYSFGSKVTAQVRIGKNSKKDIPKCYVDGSTISKI